MAEFRKLRIEQDAGMNTYDGRRVKDPPGYDQAAASQAGGSSGGPRAPVVSTAARQQALMSQATSPIKQVGMLCFMMWMSGSQLHLFSIMTTISGLYQPLTAILNVNKAFPEDPEGKLSVALPRIVFCLIQGGAVLFALAKINGMGLFPTHLSDWVSSIRAPSYAEHAVTSLLPPAAPLPQ